MFTCSSVILGTELIARPLATGTTKLTTSNKKNIFETARRKCFRKEIHRMTFEIERPNLYEYLVTL